MKQIITFLLILIAAINCESRTVITMEKVNGVYKIPCKVNGAKMKFIFDTGAATVSMSINMAEYLFENNYILQSDLVGVGQSKTADGRIVDHLRINLREIEIGGLIMKDVEAVVLESQNAPLLFGQSAIQKLGNFEINGNNLILSNPSAGLTPDEIDYYGNLGDTAMRDGDYVEAERVYKILYEADALSDYGIYELCRALDNNGKYDISIKLYNSLRNSKFARGTTYNPLTAQFNLFVNLAHAYVYTNQVGMAKVEINHGISLVDDCDFSDYPKLNKYDIKEIITYNFASLLCNSEFYSEAADYYREAIEYFGKPYNLTFSQIWNICMSTTPNSIKSDNDGYILNLLSNYIECLFYSYRWSDRETDNAMISLARNGGKNARVFCNSNSVQY